ncbi:MAG TPA: TetR/AcrR family transcriptional regulator [Clostridiaceae bacterium]
MDTITENDLSRKEKIVNATLEIMKKEGIDGVTIRKIASRAEVNVALINYHFGSKENLINEALKILVGDLRYSFSILEDSNLSSREKLQSFLVKYFSVAIRYPDIIRNILLKGSVSSKSQIEFLQFLKTSGLGKIQDILRDLTGNSNPIELTSIMFQIIGAVAFPLLIFPVINTVAQLDATLVGSLDDYISKLLDNYFGKYNKINKEVYYGN